ncbi:hypothetical protein ACFL1X_00475 [Candidatus Hydrogenedentota bacterium]
MLYPLSYGRLEFEMSLLDDILYNRWVDYRHKNLVLYRIEYTPASLSIQLFFLLRRFIIGFDVGMPIMPLRTSMITVRMGISGRKGGKTTSCSSCDEVIRNALVVG